MLEELKGATEIAIDTEHHDYRTYGGLLSLMQISTREKDWIVDTLQPWRRKLEVLNEVFADPNIIKVSSSFPSNFIPAADSSRYYMAPTWILFGSNETVVSTLSVSSTHSKPQWHLGILEEVSRTCSRDLSTLMRTRSTS